ncbi:MAG TPA: hypothetical protein VN665_02635 [Candidatus Paceibacterota bacterium]|nr:hypothetical protein [Candidatus Paceibacterota bacterium]
MDELEISGRRYISAARAAKEYKYHSDYIGQLIRGKKVVGQKVGRAWYVDADSLAEYLGKEVPARGPVVKKEKTVEDAFLEQKVSDFVTETRNETVTKEKSGGSGEKPVAEPVDVRGISPEPEQSELNEAEPMFVMPLRKSGRAHTIAAIGEVSVQKVEEQPVYVEPVKVNKIVIEKSAEEKIEEPVVESGVEPEEETFIPLKISKEHAPRNIYAEPEDSFYKVSRKSLRYVTPNTHQEVLQQTRAVPAARRPQVKEKRSSRNALAAVSYILVAGIISLGVGMLMSYYLHSITTVQGSAQTSSVFLSN